MMMANMAGTIKSVAKVETSRPPITARPSGAVMPLPSSRARAMGTVPRTIALAVMRMGRRRSRAPSMAALCGEAPAPQ